jgi:hypothetical protein
MQYEAVYLYTGTQEFIGVAIKKVGVNKLQSVNIWSDSPSDVEDFKSTLAGLNDEEVLRQHWPSAGDPDVVTLVENPDWWPLKLSEELVPDWENSVVVDDEFGGIDTEQSKIVYKTAMVPDPQEAQQRYFKAQETVARNRALAASQ